MTNCIEINGLIKKYPLFTLGPVDLTVPAGSIVGLIGENGAGKTTLLKSMLGVCIPTAGQVRLLEQSGEKREVREQIGTVLDQCLFPDMLTTKEVGMILSRVYHTWDKALYHQLLERMELPRNLFLKDFSRGMKMKLSLCAALSHHPALLVLDEATGGLDPVVRDELLEELMDFVSQGDRAILMSSHITTDLSKAADYIAYLHQGKMVLFEEKDRLLEEHGRLVCGREQFQTVDPAYVVRYREEKYSVEALVRDKAAFRRKYPALTVDAVALDDFMVFMERGEAL